jgi:hypothetical protein
MKLLLLGLLLLCCALCIGCSDATYWWQRTLIQADCRPDHLTNGQCTSTKKGTSNAQTAHP